MISLFSGLFPIFPLLHFSGVPTQAQSSVMLYLLAIYDEFVACSSGKELLLELSRLFKAYADHSSLESIALKACSVLVALALQKPHRIRIMLLTSTAN